MASPPERRLGPRVILDASAIIRVEALTPEVSTRILDASERGLSLALPASRPLGTRIHVTIRIEDPRYEITVSGIIVHVAAFAGADPRLTARAGIYLTRVGADWIALCRRIARFSK